MSSNLETRPRETPSMKSSLIAIGLDAADPTLLERWMDEGRLPILQGLRERGCYGRLRTAEHHRAETPWTTFLTGRTPESTGYWSPLAFDPETYRVESRGAFDYREHPAFYELGEDHRVAVFDMPQAPLSERVNGAQVLAWGAHSPQTEAASRPEALLDELTAAHGAHPLGRHDGANVFDAAGLRAHAALLQEGIRRRSAACRDLIAREPWDLFLAVFGESHVAGHYYWHLGLADHPLHSAMRDAVDGNPLLEAHLAIDRALGEIFATAGEGATQLVFSAHGMGPNGMDLPSLVFLPELLYRLHFGRAAIAPGTRGASLGEPLHGARLAREGWARVLWSRTRESALRNPLKRHLPHRAYRHVERLLGAHDDPRGPESPFALLGRGESEPFQPAHWFRRHWPDMRAFALPSFSEGYVRINLAGREAHGVVPPEDFERTRDEICEVLQRLTDARSGRPIVRDLVRTKRTPGHDDASQPDADIVVLWEDDCVTDTVDSPDVGRIGPAPYLRTGSHRSEGFLAVAGPGIPEGRRLAEGHAVDLAPTLLSLMGAPTGADLEGRALVLREEER